MGIFVKVLILSCNTGQGHNQAGKAIFEKLQERGIPCEFLDTLSFAGKSVSKKIAKSYNFIATKAPHFFGVIYAAGGLISSSKRKSPVYYVNRLYKENLYQYIVEHQFDVVFMPHLFPAQVITGLREDHEDFNIKTVAIATDYTCIPFWEETSMDYFVIPHKELAEEFCNHGIDEERLLPFGIPVKEAFRTRLSKREAREQLGLDPDKDMYLIMSGSMGHGDSERFIRQILRRYGNSLNVVLLGGTNTKMKAKLRRRFAAQENIHIKGFTKRVSIYMDACDVLFTKPGGLTSTEAAVKNIPLVLTDPIPGCETKNARFFTEKGMAFYHKHVSSQIEAADQLLRDEQIREKMLQAQRENINSHASDDICDIVLKWNLE